MPETKENSDELENVQEMKNEEEISKTLAHGHQFPESGEINNAQENKASEDVAINGDDKNLE